MRATTAASRTCGGPDPYLVLARRDVDAGEELTVDCATITDDPDFATRCRCGAGSCRGLVTGVDWRLPELQARYGDHWVPVLRDRTAGAGAPEASADA